MTNRPPNHPPESATDVAPGAAVFSDQWVREHRSELLDFCTELLRVPSDNPPGDCGSIADLAASTCERLGLAVTKLVVPRPEGIDSLIVLAWLGRETSTPALLVNAHLDVIPPGFGWSVDPYGGALVGGRIYGRGAAASKADVAAYVFGLAAAKAALGRSTGQSCVVALTSDEETGGKYGPCWLLQDYGLSPGLAICPGSTYRVATSHSGCIQARVTISATPQHAATADTASDAWPIALRVLDRIESLRAVLNERRSEISGIQTANIVVSGIEGGGVPGVTMGHITISLDRRVIPEEDADAALSELQEAVRPSNGGAVSVNFEPTLVVSAVRPNERQRNLADTVREEASNVLGVVVPTTGLPIFTDARWFANHGIPTVMFGVGYDEPTDGQGHGPDENAGVAEIEATARVIGRVIVRVLSNASPASRAKIE